jgi:ribosomal protein S12 methylthiotransferase accessory factor
MPVAAPTAQKKAPADTLRDVAPYLKEAGVTRLCNLTGMDRIGIPVFASIRPDSQVLAVDSGKGFDPIQAKCSAAMESLERWAWDEAEVIDWEGYVIHNSVVDFPLTKGAHFNPAYPHRWTEAKVWTSEDAKVAVPYYCVKYYPKLIPMYQMCWHTSTNGLAAGNTVAEAICSGLYEVIERDAVSISMCRHERLKRLNLDSIEYDDCCEMLDMCENAGITVHISDVTSDIGVPAFMCIMVDRQVPDIGLYKGYGCHLSSHVALKRSICEAAQSRAVFIAGARDDMTVSKRRAFKQIALSRDWIESLLNERVQDYAPAPEMSMSDDDAILYVEELLKERGLGRVLVINMLERPHLAVVKVLVSGASGYWNVHLEPGKRAMR